MAFLKMPARRHGESTVLGRTPEYTAWNRMLSRCYYPKNNRYHLYGGRGIQVCQRWRESYLAFLDDVGRKPSPRHSLDRIDSSGHYAAENCRWATPEQQNQNRRNALNITHRGVTKNVVEWAREFRVAPTSIREWTRRHPGEDVIQHYIERGRNV